MYFTIPKGGLHGRSCRPIWDVSAFGLSYTRVANFLPPWQWIGWDIVVQPGPACVFFVHVVFLVSIHQLHSLELVVWNLNVAFSLSQWGTEDMQMKGTSPWWEPRAIKCSLLLSLVGQSVALNADRISAFPVLAFLTRSTLFFSNFSGPKQINVSWTWSHNVGCVCSAFSLALIRPFVVDGAKTIKYWSIYLGFSCRRNDDYNDNHHHHSTTSTHYKSRWCFFVLFGKCVFFSWTCLVYYSCVFSGVFACRFVVCLFVFVCLFRCLFCFQFEHLPFWCVSIVAGLHLKCDDDVLV